MECDGAKWAGIDAGKTGLAPVEIDRDPAGLFVSFEGLILAGLDALTCFALTANDDLRSLVFEGGENVDSRLLETVTPLLGRRAGQLAELASGASFFGYFEFHVFSGNPVFSHFRSFR